MSAEAVGDLFRRVMADPALTNEQRTMQILSAQRGLGVSDEDLLRETGITQANLDEGRQYFNTQTPLGSDQIMYNWDQNAPPASQGANTGVPGSMGPPAPGSYTPPPRQEWTPPPPAPRPQGAPAQGFKNDWNQPGYNSPVTQPTAPPPQPSNASQQAGYYRPGSSYAAAGKGSFANPTFRQNLNANSGYFPPNYPTSGSKGAPFQPSYSSKSGGSQPRYSSKSGGSQPNY